MEGILTNLVEGSISSYKIVEELGGLFIFFNGNKRASICISVAKEEIGVSIRTSEDFENDPFYSLPKNSFIFKNPKC